MSRSAAAASGSGVCGRLLPVQGRIARVPLPGLRKRAGAGALSMNLPDSRCTGIPCRRPNLFPAPGNCGGEQKTGACRQKALSDNTML